MRLDRRRLQPVRLGPLRQGLAAIQGRAEGIDHASQPGLARANAVLIGREDHARADANAVEAVERQQVRASLVDRHDFREQWLASLALAPA